MVYTTRAQVEQHLAREVDPSYRERVEALIVDATTLVAFETGQQWGVTDGDCETKKRVECNGQSVLPIPAAVSVVSVTLHWGDGTTQVLVQDTDWFARPAGSGDSVEPEGITGLQYAYGAAWDANDAAFSYGPWPDPPCYVEIEAMWAGAASVPADIALATALIVAAWCRAQGIGASSPADVKSESWGDYTVSYGDGTKTDSPRAIPPEAQRILDSYRAGGSDDEWAVGV